MNEKISNIFVQAFHLEVKLQSLTQDFQVNTSSKILLFKIFMKESISVALQLAATTPILPISASRQSIDESIILRKLRMDDLQVCVEFNQ